MNFRTEYKAQRGKLTLDPRHAVVLLGSCFTDYIGERMRSCRWRAFPNICGTLFNPASIANIISLAVNHHKASGQIKDSIVMRDDLWVSWLTDSRCARYSERDTFETVDCRLLRLNDRLREAHTLIITFGTAWVYALKENPDYIVSNCHKFHPCTFIRRRLTVEEIVAEWNDIIRQLRSFNPRIQLLFTVSPVRHLKDGFEGNSRSKAILQLACEEICKNNELADYFPAFEIVNDDLRDYRFYCNDMVHPSQEAVDYIWEKFQEQYLTTESRSLLAEGEKVTKRLNHHPLTYGESQRALYQASLERLHAYEIYNAFIAKYPFMLADDE